MRHLKATDASALTHSVWQGSWMTCTRVKVFLREYTQDSSRMRLTLSTPSGPSRGTREMRGFLKEVPWAAGTSNITEVQASSLDEPVATFRATFRPIEIIPSIFTVSHFPWTLLPLLIYRSIEVMARGRSRLRHAIATRMCCVVLNGQLSSPRTQ